MTRNLLIATVLLTLPFRALAADSASAPAGDKPAVEKPLAIVNGVAIPAIVGDIVRQARTARGMPPESLSDESVREAAVASELLAQDAVKKGLDKNPRVIAAIEFQKKDLLSKADLEDFIDHNPIPEATVKAEYDKAKEKAGNLEYRPRHILVDSEKEALAIIAKLKNRKNKFEKLASQLSKDSTAKNGGDLGWVVPANLVPEFSEALVKLKKGETSATPVKTRFGWHVIKLEDTRKLDFPDYDKLKERITGQLQNQAIRNYVRALLATAKVE